MSDILFVCLFCLKLELLTGIDELHPNETGKVTLWEGHSRIPLPNMNITREEEGSSS